jgi:hypothetical protein
MKLSLVSTILFALSGLVAGFSDKQGKSATPAKPGSHIGHIKHAPHKRVIMAKARLEHQISEESVDKPVHSGPASLEKRSFRGQGTYFYPGQGTSPVLEGCIQQAYDISPTLGACGWTASSKDHIAALNHDQYGDMGGRSSLCGRWIWIKNVQTGQSTRAQIQGEAQHY